VQRDISELSPTELEAVRSAVEAVVTRDVERTAARLADPDRVSEFWRWADDYGRQGRLDLVMPPGPTADWIDAVPLADGSGFAIDVDMWAASGRTDLTLSLRLATHPDAPEVVLEDMHVL
jgi:hypothetical protein